MNKLIEGYRNTEPLNLKKLFAGKFTEIGELKESLEFKEEQKTAANAFLYGMLATGALAIGSAAYLFLRAGMQRKRELKALEERNGK